jgi:hypothetical protein
MAVYADQELEANFTSWDYDGAGGREEGSGGVVLSAVLVNLHIFPKISLREIPWCYPLLLSATSCAVIIFNCRQLRQILLCMRAAGNSVYRMKNE